MTSIQFCTNNSCDNKAVSGSLLCKQCKIELFSSKEKLLCNADEWKKRVKAVQLALNAYNTQYKNQKKELADSTKNTQRHYTFVEAEMILLQSINNGIDLHEAIAIYFYNKNKRAFEAILKFGTKMQEFHEKISAEILSFVHSNSEAKSKQEGVESLPTPMDIDCDEDDDEDDGDVDLKLLSTTLSQLSLSM